MTAAAPYYLISERIILRLQTSLLSALQELAKRWWPLAVDIEISAREFIARADAGKSSSEIYECGQHYLIISASDVEWIKAASGWLGSNAEYSSPLAKELQRQFCEELASATCSIAKIYKCAEARAESIVNTYLQPGSGGIIIDISINNFTCRVLTSIANFPTLAQIEETKAKFLLNSAADALKASPLVFEAHLPKVKMPITQISNLMAGDFINLQLDLSGEVILSGRDSDVHLKAELGQRNEKKAALLISENGK